MMKKIIQQKGIGKIKATTPKVTEFHIIYNTIEDVCLVRRIRHSLNAVGYFNQHFAKGSARIEALLKFIFSPFKSFLIAIDFN